MGNETGCADAQVRALRNGFASGVVQCSLPPARTVTGSAKALASEGGRYKCPDDFGACRPAGTREALPGTMCRDCALRFKRKGTMYRTPTKKNGWRAISRHAQKN